MGARVDQLMKAIYSFQPDEEAWLKRIVEAVEPLQLSGGVIAYTSSLGAKTSLRTLVNHSETSSEDVRTNATFTPPPIFRRLHAPMPLSHSARLFPQVLSEFGLDYERFLPSVPYPMPPAMWGLSGGDAGVESALITFLCRSGEEFHPRERRTLDAVGAHLSSALRLRSLLRGPLEPSHHVVDAVMAPDGRVLDARNELREEPLRAPLIDALRRNERAALRSADPEERLDVWTALVECRWSIVETVERDGKRMMLVCRNDPHASSLRALTKRERLVVSLAALGHSYKYIAYEVGIPLSTAAALLKSALPKLGLASRAELIRLYARIVAQGPAEPAD